MTALVIKSLHVIFVVTWFAGLFYGYRLFAYHAEALTKPSPEKEILSRQYTIMQKRLWHIIAWPSLVLTLLFGIWLIIINPDFLKLPWMHVKLSFVLALCVYQIYGELLINRFKSGVNTPSPMKMRLFNEIPTVALVACIFLVELQDALSWIWGVLGIMGLAFALGTATKLYKNYRVRTGK